MVHIVLLVILFAGRRTRWFCVLYMKCPAVCGNSSFQKLGAFALIHNVQLSHPYKRIDRTRVLYSLNFTLKLILLLFRTVRFDNAPVARAILLLISVIDWPSEEIVAPRYLKVLTSSRVMLFISMEGCLLICW